MSDYNIVIGPTEFFICRHPHEPHDGPCERSSFTDDPECICTDEERVARRCKIQCPPHWRPTSPGREGTE